MTNRKIFLIAAIPVLLLLVFFASGFAFRLISAPSDLSVVLGVVTLSVLIFILVKFSLYLINTFKNER